MAINRINNPSSIPTAVSDYQAQNTLTSAGFKDGANPWLGTAMQIGYIFQLGGTIYSVDTATAITGTASPYVKITPSGSTATASFVANLSGVAWNTLYNGYYDGSGNLYLFDEGLAVKNGVLATPKTILGYLTSQIRTDFANADTSIRTDFANADTSIRTDMANADTSIRTDMATSHGKKMWIGATSTSWTAPVGVTSVHIIAFGAGGGGAGVGAGGGGGGGAYYIGDKSVVPGTSYPIVLSSSGNSTLFGYTLGKGGDGIIAGGAGGIGLGGASNGASGGIGGATGSSGSNSILEKGGTGSYTTGSGGGGGGGYGAGGDAISTGQNGGAGAGGGGGSISGGVGGSPILILEW